MMEPLDAITILGFDYPDDELNALMHGDRRPQVQTRLFARRLTQALLGAFALPVHCISAAPISEYPTSPHLFVQRSRNATIETCEGLVTFESLSYVNSRVMKILTRQAASFAAVLRRWRHQRGGYVFVYSVHVPFLASGLLLAKLSRSACVAVWTDPPAVPLAKNPRRAERTFRTLENRLSRILARRFEHVIAVTSTLASDLAPEARVLVVEAMTDPEPRPETHYRDAGLAVFTYTGGVSKKYGVDALVEAVRRLPADGPVRLRIYGSGDYSEELQTISRQYDHIEYMGEVGHAEALLAQTSSDFLINPRNATEEFTRYSFPSKLLEYLASGVPVLTTKLPGIPSEYWRVLIPLEGNAPPTIGDALVAASRMSAATRRAIGEEGRALATAKTFRAQGVRIRDFLTLGEDA